MRCITKGIKTHRPWTPFVEGEKVTGERLTEDYLTGHNGRESGVYRALVGTTYSG
jgi:hypothetical protein